ncbi:hypothetical protein BKH46_05870 [Helicobacter sp. 12S02634-8]|uniref:tight adherence pilus pseudopilin TadF n=1 Tax=Helicobacter sp. 12S02634-8 TaxID=1476199 RepID=UPI000BA7B4F7|nr:tight adherence pilus pseudopilin TadF [Helicobacter sp. 12S02634-8]PAF46963.1 hypothetical protein BKH46_05870 [Helicobacter sp. 12S02634-8]
MLFLSPRFTPLSTPSERSLPSKRSFADHQDPLFTHSSQPPKLPNKPLFKRLMAHTQGSVSIEASLIFGLLILLIVLLAQTGQALINQSRLDRLSYSLLSLARESSLYANAPFSSNDATGLYRILNTLSKDMMPLHTDLALKIEVLHFSSDGISRSTQSVQSYDFGPFACQTPNNLQDNANLSVMTAQQRYAPLYRVSVCMQQTSKFSLQNLITRFIPLSSSSIAMGR